MRMTKQKFCKILCGARIPAQLVLWLLSWSLAHKGYQHLISLEVYGNLNVKVYSRHKRQSATASARLGKSSHTAMCLTPLSVPSKVLAATKVRAQDNA